MTDTVACVLSHSQSGALEKQEAKAFVKDVMKEMKKDNGDDDKEMNSGTKAGEDGEERAQTQSRQINAIAEAAAARSQSSEQTNADARTEKAKKHFATVRPTTCCPPTRCDSFPSRETALLGCRAVQLRAAVVKKKENQTAFGDIVRKAMATEKRLEAAAEAKEKENVAQVRLGGHNSRHTSTKRAVALRKEAEREERARGREGASREGAAQGVPIHRR